MLDWLFRPRCAACGAAEAPLCLACRGSLVELGIACPRCAQPNQHGGVCRRCEYDPLPLDRIIVPWRFGGQLASAIRRLKFTGATEVARTLAPLWAPVLAALASDGAIVVPVPLHWKRRLQRGYDHAWLLARHACALAGIAAPVPLLRRIRTAPPQSTLPAAERRKNVAGAFAVKGELPDRPIILLDDVVTTGSTLSAAADALLDAGATSIVGVALARAD